MEITRSDIQRLQNVAKALRRGKYELDGEEVLAFAQTMAWVGDAINRFEKALADQEAALKEAQAKSEEPVSKRGRK